jgi:hypothetical protein
MTVPSWQEDDSRNLTLIQSNAAQLITELRATAAERIPLTPEELCRWHTRLYAGCTVPIAGYVGHFRGDPAVNELIDYEVGLGLPLKDGNFEKMGLWACRVGDELVAFICLRYDLPMFLHIKPRPESDDYLRASRDSMGRPPDFIRNHTTTTAVFAHMLADVLEGERIS